MGGRTHNRYNNQPIVNQDLLVRSPPCYQSQCNRYQRQDGEDDEDGQQLRRLVFGQLFLVQGSHGWQRLRSVVMIGRSRDSRTRMVRWTRSEEKINYNMGGDIAQRVAFWGHLGFMRRGEDALMLVAACRRLVTNWSEVMVKTDAYLRATWTTRAT